MNRYFVILKEDAGLLLPYSALFYGPRPVGRTSKQSSEPIDQLSDQNDWDWPEVANAR